MGRARKMSPAAKQVVDGAMNREKTLGLPRRFEPAHVSFSLPRRLMGDFRAVVLPAPLAMNYPREDLPACCPIAGELLGHQHMRDILQPFQQLAKEVFGGVFIQPFLRQDIQHLSILIDRTPQLVALSTNWDKHFVEELRVTPPPWRPRNRFAKAWSNRRHHSRTTS